MRDLQKAKDILSSENYTCVLCLDDDVKTFTLRGVKPLFELIENKESANGYSAADKVVGRATAFLYVLLGVTNLYARVISAPALSVLKENGIYTEYDVITDNIINRRGDGICPFEEAVLDLTDPQAAYGKIKRKLAEMNEANIK